MPFKVCPKCNKNNGPRTSKCDCGHEFQSKPKDKPVGPPKAAAPGVPTPVAAPTPPPEPMRVSRNLSHIIAPGTGHTGKIPLIPAKCEKLEDIPGWIEKCQESADKRDCIYTPMAFRYMARQIWEGEELDKALVVINDYCRAAVVTEE